MLFPSLLVLCSGVALASTIPRQAATHSPCRFSHLYTQSQILKDPTAFEQDIFYWEGQFHQNNVGYNTANGMTYDGTLLNPVTGIANNSEKHPFSAASKEVGLPTHHALER